MGELGGYLAPPWVHKSGEVEFVVDFSMVLYVFLHMRFRCTSLILSYVGAIMGTLGRTWGLFGGLLGPICAMSESS